MENKKKSTLTPEQEDEMNKMLKPVQEICVKCKKEITYWDTKVIVNGNKYHTACFKCSLCGKQMTVQTHFKADGELFCEKCYKETKAKKCSHCGTIIGKQPTVTGPDGNIYLKTCFKCAKCDKVIEGGFHVNKNGKPEHTDCNSPSGAVGNCIDCKKGLSGVKFFPLPDGTKACEECYKAKHCNNCSRCKEPIIKGAVKKIKELKFHQDCFVCNKCGISLDGRRIKIKDRALICREGCPGETPKAEETKSDKSKTEERNADKTKAKETDATPSKTEEKKSVGAQADEENKDTEE